MNFFSCDQQIPNQEGYAAFNSIQRLTSIEPVFHFNLLLDEQERVYQSQQPIYV